MKKSSLSKSQYVRGRRCVKRLWLHKNRRELHEPPSPFVDGIIQQGIEVGILARSLFPGGELIAEDHTQPDEALRHTQRAMKAGTEVLFEAAFEFDGILMRADILRRNADGSWDLLEVKSATNSQRPKKDHLVDLAVQKYILKNAGLNLHRCHLVRLNSHYVRDGELDLQQLFTINEMDALLEPELASIGAYVDSLRTALKLPEPPDSPLGSVCKNPACEYKSHCWGDLPEDSIHYLFYINDTQRADFIKRNIHTIPQIPAGELTNYRQVRHAQAVVQGEAPPDMEKLRDHLNRLEYPIYFLDFETYGYAIPRYAHTRPYHKLAFQYSLHLKRNCDVECEHREFLHDRAEDPRRLLAERLVKDIGPRGSVVAYWATFERGVIEELARDFPDLAPALTSIARRLWDLETPFGQRWVCRSSFKGRSSIKTVLPGIVPGFGYHDLQVQAGDQAMEVYIQLIETTDETLRANLKQALLEYCKRDSWAMVLILEHLRAICPRT